MDKCVLSVLVENKAGVLSRVSGLFSRRGYNIDGFLNKVYILEQEYSVVLFHLPDNLHNYVATLVN